MNFTLISEHDPDFLFGTQICLENFFHNDHRWSLEKKIPKNAHHRLACWLRAANTQKPTQIAAGKHHGTSIRGQMVSVKTFYVVFDTFLFHRVGYFFSGPMLKAHLARWTFLCRINSIIHQPFSRLARLLMLEREMKPDWNGNFLSLSN